jgi:hypothetical protein
MLAPAARVIKPRRVGSMDLVGLVTDVFVGGVLCTLSAWIIGFASFVVRVRAGAEVDASPRLAFTLYVIMAKSISVKLKKAGRPATGTEPLYGVRITDALMTQIMNWASANGATRSEAIRRLVELGLTMKAPAKPVSKPGRLFRAQELAGQAIDKIGDPAAHPEERAQRRRHLTKGPEEFREVRVDRAKAKK